MLSVPLVDNGSYCIEAEVLKALMQPRASCYYTEGGDDKVLQWAKIYQYYIRRPSEQNCTKKASLEKEKYEQISEIREKDTTSTIEENPIFTIIPPLRKEKYEQISEIREKDTTNSILNMYEMLRVRGEIYCYLSDRLHEIIEDEPEVLLNDKSFVSLYKFVRQNRFKISDFSLQVSDEGNAYLQKTFEKGFVLVEFLNDNNIFYNIMVKNKDITNLGTYDDFFKDFVANPIKE